jgi:muramoyltetrapeptide carboxypeptidase
MPLSCLPPPLLRPGDAVGLAATAGKLRLADIQPAVALLEAWGLRPVWAPNVLDEDGYFAGSDEARLQGLQGLLDRPDLRAICCVRGGYGTSRLLHRLRWEAFDASPKWIVGFSDVTALHAALQARGWQSLHGPTLNAWKHPEAVERLRACLFEGPQPLSAPPQAGNRPGQAEGPLVGGNLCLLAHLAGSAEALQAQGGILLLEEVGEAPYRIDRCLVQLRRAGLLDGLAGAAVGDMGADAEAWEAFGTPLHGLLRDYLPAGVPIASGFPIGHIAQNMAVCCGRTTRITVHEHGSTLEPLALEG